MRGRWIIFALLFTACGDGRPPPPPGPVPSVLLENKSQYELVELRVHRDASYLEETNMIAELGAIAIDEQLLYYGEGSTYFTVFRERFAGGEMWALTSAQPFNLERGKGYRLSVFDLSFRLNQETYVKPEETMLPILGDPSD
jgi:hypothetical protein